MRIKVTLADGKIRKLLVRRDHILRDISKFTSIKESALELEYIDEDGDVITADTEQELRDAIFVEHVLKFNVKESSKERIDDFIPHKSRKTANAEDNDLNRDTDSNNVQNDNDVSNEQTQHTHKEASTSQFLQEISRTIGEVTMGPSSNQSSEDDSTHSDHDSNGSLQDIKCSLASYHEKEYGVTVEINHKKEGGKVFLISGLCNASIDIRTNWGNMKKHFSKLSHKSNLYSVYGRESEDIASSVELSEIQAKRFVENEAPGEFKIDDKDGNIALVCLFCHSKAFQLAGRPSYKTRVRDHMKSKRHLDAKNSNNRGKKYEQKSIFSFVSSKSTTSREQDHE